jgi:hypothetical protein
MTLKAPHTSLTLFAEIMSKQVLISMLRQGNTGNEILSILDALTSDAVADVVTDDVVPTLEEIEF